MKQKRLNHSVFLHSSMIIFTILATRKCHESMDILIATSTTQIFEFPNFEGAKGSTPMGTTYCSHKFPHPPLWHSMMPCNKADASPVATFLWYSSWSPLKGNRAFFVRFWYNPMNKYYFLLKQLGHLNHLVSFTLGNVPWLFTFCVTISGSSINLGTSNPPR